MKTQMMIKCKNNKTEISRLWLPEILLSLASLFLGVVNDALDRWSRTIGKCIGARPSALHSTRRIASFVMLSTSNIDEVSFMSRRGRRETIWQGTATCVHEADRAVVTIHIWQIAHPWDVETLPHWLVTSTPLSIVARWLDG
jgi:hypothetical protein